MVPVVLEAQAVLVIDLLRNGFDNLKRKVHGTLKPLRQKVLWARPPVSLVKLDGHFVEEQATIILDLKKYILQVTL